MKKQNNTVSDKNTDEFIYWLFRDRCMVCQRPGTEINEIVPRSRGYKDSMDWHNRVLMCHFCHSEYHRNGVSPDAILDMQELRIDVLISLGREEYV